MESLQRHTERRQGRKPVPEDVVSRLTELQRLTLVRLESFGWAIRYVRRPLFNDQVVIVTDPTGKDVAILTEDGKLDRSSRLRIR